MVLLTLAASLGAQFKRAEPSQTPAQPPASSPAQGSPPAGDDQVIKVDVSLVNLYFTVRENRGGYVANLTKDDFEVYEDGQPQAIKTFARETDQPLTLGLMVDVSGSQTRLLEDERAASARFFEQVLRTKDDAFLLSFGVESELLQDFTNSHTLLERALRDMRMNAGVGGGITPTTVPSRGPRHGTVRSGLARRQREDAPRGRPQGAGADHRRRRPGQPYQAREAVEAAQKADSIIYVILYEDPRFHGPCSWAAAARPRARCASFTDETGGRTFRVDRRNC